MTIKEVVHTINIVEQLFHIADETATVRKNLLELIEAIPTQGKQIHDANIVATMLANQIETLATINTDDFKRFASKIKLISLKE